MNRDELDALLRFLNPDRDLAGERYEAIRHRLIRLFEWRGCSAPEDLADQTINRVARRVLGGLELERPDPYAYFCGVANLVHKEDIRREARERKRDSELPPPNLPVEEPDNRLDPLRHCLRTLDAEQQRLVLRYHEDGKRIQARKDLCQELGIEMNALRIRVHRLRRKIEACIQERLRG